MVICKSCHSSQIVKNGFVRKKQRYRCKDCGCRFVEGDARKKESVAVKKTLTVILYSLGKSSFGFLGKLFGVSRSLTYRWIRDEARLLSEPEISNEIKEIEFDEMWHFIQSKKNKKWSIKAVDRSRGRTIAWVISNGDAATFKRLYEKVKHLTDGKFYTDNWDSFREVLPAERHIIGKSGTVMIERDNSNTRHYLGRMTRRTKVVSKQEDIIHASMKLWLALTNSIIFAQYQQKWLSIFR